MANNTSDRDNNVADSADELVELPRYELGRLMRVAEEEIDFEDHGDFVVVLREDLTRLRAIAHSMDREMREALDDFE